MVAAALTTQGKGQARICDGKEGGRRLGRRGQRWMHYFDRFRFNGYSGAKSLSSAPCLTRQSQCLHAPPAGQAARIDCTWWLGGVVVGVGRAHKDGLPWPIELFAAVRFACLCGVDRACWLVPLATRHVMHTHQHKPSYSEPCYLMLGLVSSHPSPSYTGTHRLVLPWDDDVRTTLSPSRSLAFDRRHARLLHIRMAHSMESRQSRLSRISSRTDTEIFDDGKGEKRYVLDLVRLASRRGGEWAGGGTRWKPRDEIRQEAHFSLQSQVIMALHVYW